MRSFAGVARVVRFNWPWYAGAAAATTLGFAVLAWWIPAGPWRVAAVAALAIGDGWLLLSLAVTHAVYDRSALACGGWLDDQPTASIAIFHAGHDEASAHVSRLLPGAVRQVFDICDPASGLSPSLRRARAEAATMAQAVPSGRIPLPDAAVGLAVVVFAAHELRDDTARTGFFRELARIVGSHGRILVVEHQRDAWNLLAYGPGFLHFLSRRTWLRTFAGAGLGLARDRTFTPWVHAFELRQAA